MMQTRSEIESSGKIGENACITATFPVIDDCSDSIEKHPTASEHEKKEHQVETSGPHNRTSLTVPASVNLPATLKPPANLTLPA